MDSIQNAIQDKLGDAVLGSLGKKFGLDLSKASGLMKMALPLVLGALAKNATSKKGVAGISKALDKDHDGAIMDHLEDIAEDDAIQKDGSKIISHVFGDKQSEVTAMLSKTSDADPKAVEGMLSSLAPVVMGQLGKAKKEQALDDDSLAQMLKGEETEAKNKLGGIMALLDRDNDGSVMDDILDMGKRFLR